VAALAAKADEEVADRLRELRPGLAGVQEKSLTLQEAADKFIRHLELGKSRASSVAKHRAELQAICRLLRVDTAAAKVGKRDVAAMRDLLLQLPANWQRVSTPPAPASEGEKTLTPTTVERVLQTGRRWYRWLHKEGLMHRGSNPFEDIEVARGSGNGDVRPPTVAEADALCALPCPNRFDALSWKAAPAVARYAGMRLAEVGQFQAEDIVMVHGVRCISVSASRGRTLKTASSERLVPISDRLAPHADELLAARPQGQLMHLGDYETKRGVVKVAHYFGRRFATRAKKVAEDLSFKSLRAYASNAMLSAGVGETDVDRLLGHAVSRINRAYKGINLARLKKAVDSIA